MGNESRSLHDLFGIAGGGAGDPGGGRSAEGKESCHGFGYEVGLVSDSSARWWKWQGSIEPTAQRHCGGRPRR